MKRKILFLVLCLAGFNHCKAQTSVSGVLTGNVTWDLSGSPYIVTGDITVSQGSTLSIMPLVQVKFDGDYWMNIDGTIRAIGAPDSLIEFTTNTFIPSHYEGLFFSPTAIDYDFNNNTGCILQYCSFQWASGSILPPGNCWSFQGHVINSNEGTPFVDNCKFDGVGGIWKGCSIRSDFYFTNNKIINNLGNLLDCGFDFPNKVAVVSCNIFKANASSSTPAIIFGGRNLTISHNIVASNYYNNFALQSNFEYNTVYDNDMGNEFLSCSDDNTFNHNLFTQNRFNSWASTQASIVLILDTLAVISNNNFINNNLTISPGDGSYVRNFITRQQYLSPHINATQNYWGTTDTNFINYAIFDYYDDTTKHHIDYQSILITPDINAPISPVQNLTRIDLGGNNVQLSWDANLESDLAGYRIYWGSYTGYSYSNQIDVGNITIYTLSVAPGDSIAVTAYDINSTMFEDFCSGQESWFSSPKLTAVGIGETKPVHSTLGFSPNPFSNYTQGTISESFKEKDFNLILFDEFGRKIRQENIQSKIFKVYRNNLTQGIYFYQLSDNRKNVLVRGKLIMTD